MVCTNPLCVIIPLALQVLLLPSGQGQASPPTSAPVWYESCYWYGPPNITANPPEDKYGHVMIKSFDMSWGVQPTSYNITYNIDKLLPGGRAVTQLEPGGKTVTMNEDLCDFVRGGCPIHPGDFMVTFNLTIDHWYNQLQFSIFTKAGELLQCVFLDV